MLPAKFGLGGDNQITLIVTNSVSLSQSLHYPLFVVVTHQPTMNRTFLCMDSLILIIFTLSFCSVVKEELAEEEALLPQANGRVVCWVSLYLLYSSYTMTIF